MTVDEYWAAVRRLGLHRISGNTFRTAAGDVYWIRDPTSLNPDQRSEFIDRLKVLMGIAPPSGNYN